jgi:large subunit ribosomal protein L15
VIDLDRFDDGTKVDRALLAENGLISKKSEFVKILGDGELTKKLTVSVDKVSSVARQKIEAAGGSLEE